MYLAVKELLFSKWKYSLIIGFITLIAFLIYFLSGLAFGLANNNRSAVDNWQAQQVYFTKYSNKNLLLSQINPAQVTTPDGSVPLKVNNAVTEINKKKVDSTIFSINSDSFIKPELSTGRFIDKSGEVVVDRSIDPKNIHVGQKLKLNGHQEQLKVVGITDDNRYNTLPVIYVDNSDYYAIFGSRNINGFITQKAGAVKTNSELERISTNTLINNIPGYSAQVQTFTLMIASLFIIVGFIIAIFMYILTLEKLSIYGTMRAQGISTRRIVSSLLWQALIIGLTGVGIALLANWITMLFLPATVPFGANPWLILIFSLGLIGAIILGTIFSIIKVVKIDPLEAVGGN